MTEPAGKTLVLGVGNPLMGDEGVGPRTVEHLLSHFRFPPSVEVVDAGTMGFGMLNIFEGVGVAVVVDAIDGTGHEPGTVLLLDPGSLAKNQIMHSLHDARLPDVLDAARLIGLEPEVLCVAVQVERIVQWELELTPAVEDAVARTAEAVVGLLSERGIRVTRLDSAPGSGDVAGNAAQDLAAGPVDSVPGGGRSGADDAARAVRILRGLRTRHDVDD